MRRLVELHGDGNTYKVNLERTSVLGTMSAERYAEMLAQRISKELHEHRQRTLNFLAHYSCCHEYFIPRAITRQRCQGVARKGGVPQSVGGRGR